ncbi:MAG: AI-2E family transporter [Gammaproteobacteria bacterium]|nr:AI-2E family transporter [Gammaproteobacteria bacterium]
MEAASAMIIDSTKWFVFAGIIVASVLLYLLAPVLSPFLAGTLLAYLGDPLVDRLETYKLPRTAAVVVVFVTILLLLLLLPLILLPLIEQQISALVAKLPAYIDWIQQTVIPFLSQALNIESGVLDMTSLKQAVAKHWREMGGIATNVVTMVSQSGLMMVAWLANLVLIPVVTFYLLRDWDVVVARIRALLPRRNEATIVQLARESDEVLGAFLRGQLIVMIALGVIYSVGLWVVGLELAFLIGMIAGLVSFVPYLGTIVGILLASVAAVMQFQDVVHLAFVAVVFGVGQMLEGMLLTPLMVGDKIGLHPVAVIFAVMAGGQLFGFVGILVALPVAAVIAVLLRHAVQRYTDSGLYADKQ